MAKQSAEDLWWEEDTSRVNTLAEDARRMGITIHIPLDDEDNGVENKFNPNQPRDSQGRFGSGGGSGGGSGEYEFGKVLSPEEAAEVISDIRAGDETSKNEGRKSPETIREPMVYSEVPTTLFDTLPDE